MEKAEFRRNADDMIYLTICAIKGIVPEQKRIEKLNLPKLFEVCQRHILTACVAYALESAGIKDNAFTQVKVKAIRKKVGDVPPFGVDIIGETNWWEEDCWA